MTNRTPWTPAENAALVRLYFRMLDAVQRSPSTLNKAALVRIAQDANAEDRRRITSTGEFAGKLANRTRGSIEAKLMNATAAHGDAYRDAFGRFPVDTMHNHGYRALSNYQRALFDAMAAEIARRSTLAGQSERLA